MEQLKDFFAAGKPSDHTSLRDRANAQHVAPRPTVHQVFLKELQSETSRADRSPLVLWAKTMMNKDVHEQETPVLFRHRY